MILDDIVTGNIYEMSDHAVQEAEDDGITVEDILLAIRQPDSRYEDEMYQTSQYTKRIHAGQSGYILRVAIDEKQSPKKIITVYALGG